MKRYYVKLLCKGTIGIKYNGIRDIFIVLIIFIFIHTSIAQVSDGVPPNSDSIIPALNFKDADIRDVIRGIAFEYETNIIIDNEINKRISIALFNVTVFNAVKLIATDNGFDFGYDSDRFYIKTIPVKEPPPPVESLPEITYTKGKLSVHLDNVKLEKFVDGLR